jgi:hypothetical protein
VSQWAVNYNWSKTRVLVSFLRIWLGVWIIGFPLIHVHPEADHGHGLPGHVHGGTFHSVVSPESPCVYADHFHHHELFSTGEPFGTANSSNHPPHGLEHPTIFFSAASASVDQEIGKPPVSHDAVAPLGVTADRPPVACFGGSSSIPTFNGPFLKTASPRAPPSLFI